jgi:xanthine dehydrogenase large subunit
LTRALDMALTGKRHPFLARYTAGLASDGRIQALKLALFSDGGWSLDLSEPIMWRALFHCDNAYHLPAVDAVGRVCRTHKTSQTAFRGFGGPQGMLVIEEILARAAAELGLPAHVVRERNFYRRDTTLRPAVEQAGRITPSDAAQGHQPLRRAPRRRGRVQRPIRRTSSAGWPSRR